MAKTTLTVFVGPDEQKAIFDAVKEDFSDTLLDLAKQVVQARFDPTDEGVEKWASRLAAQSCAIGESESYHGIVQQAVLAERYAERERCAKICEALNEKWYAEAKGLRDQDKVARLEARGDGAYLSAEAIREG